LFNENIQKAFERRSLITTRFRWNSLYIGDKKYDEIKEALEINKLLPLGPLSCEVDKEDDVVDF
jgi:hypothetical protein